MGSAAFPAPLNIVPSPWGAAAQTAPLRSRFGLGGSNPPKTSRTLATVPETPVFCGCDGDAKKDNELRVWVPNVILCVRSPFLRDFSAQRTAYASRPLATRSKTRTGRYPTGPSRDKSTRARTDGPNTPNAPGNGGIGRQARNEHARAPRPESGNVDKRRSYRRLRGSAGRGSIRRNPGSGV